MTITMTPMQGRWRWRSALKTLVVVILVSMSVVTVASGAAEAPAQEGLTVTVTTDKEVYQPGELITIQIRVTRAGQPVPARIYEAYIDITYANGWTIRRYIAWQLQPVGPGLFVVQGYAGRAGVREVHVTAYLQEYSCYGYGGWPAQCWCSCVIWGSGTATYQVVAPPPPPCPSPPPCGCNGVPDPDC